MRNLLKLALASASLLPFAAPAMAQDSGTARSGASESDQIIVTARRRDESLQDVPMTVGVVTSETLEKLNIQNFEDIESVVPGCRAVQTRGTSFMLLIGSQEDGSNDQGRPRHSAQAQGAAPR